jgi:hypothetical protein
VFIVLAKTSDIWVYVHGCVYACVHMCVCIVCVCLHACVYPWGCECVHVCVSVCMQHKNYEVCQMNSINCDFNQKEGSKFQPCFSSLYVTNHPVFSGLRQ